jgi:hypothetical protein
MIYTNPGFIYILLALLLCCIYYGIEMSTGGLHGTAKCILSSWCVTSLIILSIILGIKKIQSKKPELITSKHIMIMYGLSAGTLLCSFSIISMAA